MKSKHLISLSIAFAFLALSITGLLLYIKQKTHTIEITHTVFGLVFIGFAIFHILNNWSSIAGYSKDKLKGQWHKELKIAGIGFVLLLVGGFTELLEPIAEAGRIFANQRRMENVLFNKIKTNQNVQAVSIQLQAEMDRKAFLPVIAIWLEDTNHTFVQNLFVPGKIALPEEPDDINDVKLIPLDHTYLPTWSKISKDKSSNFGHESPRQSFILNTNISEVSKGRVVMEINNQGKISEINIPFDWSKGNIFTADKNANELAKNILLQKL